MHLSAMSLRRAQLLTPMTDVHVISIRSPGNACAVLPSGFGCVTFVAMSDQTAPEPAAIATIARAARIARDQDVRRLVVHCEMGVSRSVGAARGIAAAFGLPFDSEFPGSSVVLAAVAKELA